MIEKAEKKWSASALYVQKTFDKEDAIPKVHSQHVKTPKSQVSDGMDPQLLEKRDWERWPPDKVILRNGDYRCFLVQEAKNGKIVVPVVQVLH